MAIINLVLGTMTFGQQVFYDEAVAMVECFLDRGYRELDTAYVYNEGESEKLLGRLIERFGRDKFSIATKVNPRISGRLDGDAVRAQLMESLDRMGIDRADIFYLHFPDPNTPVESALEACGELHRAGKFTELGLSNFPAWMVADAWHKCKTNGWVVPTVYEGVYNPLSRKAETELFDALKAFDMRFYAYNPLAGGMLTDKYAAYSEMPSSGRFALRKSYAVRYWKESFFNAVGILRAACGRTGMLEAAFRWMAHHSLLDDKRGDSIIIGASSLSQLEQNIAAIKNGDLPSEMLTAFDEAWSVSRVDSPEYFTLYGSGGGGA